MNQEFDGTISPGSFYEASDRYEALDSNGYCWRMHEFPLKKADKGRFFANVFCRGG